jgi:Fe-S-cluster-containing hydrogenase component 2
MNKKIMINPSLCTGCRYCEAICSLSHSENGAINLRKARISVYSDIQKGIDIPNTCRQCSKPACKGTCEYDAISIDPKLGCIKIDETKCIGCLKCVEACPFGAIYYDEEMRLPLVCDLCGGDPMCVKFCRTLPHIGQSALSYKNPREWAKEKVLISVKKESKK